jgi:DNA-binding NarL/FixJ family response regulator
MAEIVGRDEELAAVDRFVARPRPAALVIDGEPGIGKTILWREGVRRAETQGQRVLSASPTEAEAQLPFAALGDLLAHAVDSVAEKLPLPQRRALGVALLLDEPDEAAPERRPIAVAVLSVLRLLAAGAPLVLAIDDVQWLDGDSQNALEFVFRRLGEVQMGLILARRSERDDEPLPLGLDRPAILVERIRIAGLSLGATGALVRARTGVSFRRPTLRRIHETSGGNPLFALGLADGLVRAGGEQVADELPFPRSLKEVVDDRIAVLPASTAEPLLVVAALSDCTRSALEQVFGPNLDNRLLPALEAEVIEFRQDGVRFTHPLLRSAVYARAPQIARTRLHRRLSELDLPLEERARHLALSASGPDETTASVLEDAARLAAHRGATDAAGALATRAVVLSDPNDAETIRRRRYLAAEELWASGDVDRARAEVEAIVAAAPEGPVRAQALLRLAKNPRDLLESRRLCEEALGQAHGDEALRCDVLLFLAALSIATEGGHAPGDILKEAVDVASAIGDEPRRARGEALRAFLDWSRGRPFDGGALDYAAEMDTALASTRPNLEERALYLRAIVLSAVFDIDGARESWTELERIAVETGDETAHADILNALATLEDRAGNTDLGEQYDSAAVELAEQTGLEHVLATNLGDRALRQAKRGNVEAARADAQQSLDLVSRTHEPLGVARARFALAFLALSLGDYDEAAAQIDEIVAVIDEKGTWGFGARFLTVAVEAALGRGDMDRADEIAGRLETLASATGIPHLQADARRCRGMVLAARGDWRASLRALQEAVAVAERVPVPFDRAWTLLALGEIQRRARQRRAARETLQAALAIFESLRAPLWAERARNEIARIGGRAASPDELTATEQRVAALVAEGRTNKEVAAELVVSVRAVEANLSRIYGKLGVRSRAELARKYRAETTSA